jgi:hypothetical protein
MDVLLKNCAGLDVHQKEIFACVIREQEDGMLLLKYDLFQR